MTENIDLSDLPKFLTVAETAKVLRVAVETVRRGIRAGRIRAVLIGGSYRITDEEIQRLAREGMGTVRVGRKKTSGSIGPVTLAGGRVFPGQSVEDGDDQPQPVDPDQLRLDLARRPGPGDQARRDPVRGGARIIG